MGPRTPPIPLAGALISPVALVSLAALALAALGACGAPPRALPKSPPPYTMASSGPGSVQPSLPLGMPLPTLTLTGYPTYPTNTTYPVATGTVPPRPTPTTTVPPTKSPTPTPSRAGRCTGEPTGAQILNLIKGRPGVPDATLRVFEGPFCSGTWSFATIGVDGRGTDQVEPLMVVTTGRGGTLALVAAGSEVCVARVQTGAPPGIRVLACGF